MSSKPFVVRGINCVLLKLMPFKVKRVVRKGMIVYVESLI